MDLEGYSTPIDELQQNGQLEQRNITNHVHDQSRSYKKRITIRVILRILSLTTCVVLFDLLGDTLHFRKQWKVSHTDYQSWDVDRTGEVAGLSYVSAPGR